jgi:exopolysaccharide biosynthesis polyprenyl glycosylphosphotransferase
VVSAAAEGELVITATYSSISLALALIWMLSLHIHQTRSEKVIGGGADEYKAVAVSTFRVFALVAIVAYILRADVARGYVAVALPLGVVSLLVSRWVARKWLIRSRKRGRCMSSVVLVGDALHVVPHLLTLTRSPATGFKVVGVCVPDDEKPRVEGLAPFLGRPEEAAAVALRHGVDGVIVSSTAHAGPELVKQIAWAIEGADIDLLVASALTDVAGPRIHARPVDGLPLIHVEEPRFEGGIRWAKNLMDRGIALVGLTLLAPVFAVIAILIKRSSPGPVLFPQTRVGLRGETFTMYKFRSMVQDADARVAEYSKLDEGNGVLFKMRHDPRVTRVGAVLRRWSIDELPQLINVLNGSMALVGPRPPLPREVEKYAKHVHRRLLVKPGITGLWQVSGRSDLEWDESVRLDLSYVENWTLMGDLRILWRTARAVAAGSGAY